jgi:hypothetical protein
MVESNIPVVTNKKEWKVIWGGSIIHTYSIYTTYCRAAGKACFSYNPRTWGRAQHIPFKNGKEGRKAKCTITGREGGRRGRRGEKGREEKKREEKRKDEAYLYSTVIFPAFFVAHCAAARSQ